MSSTQRPPETTVQPRKKQAAYTFAVAGAWVAALLISIGFSIHFGLELVRFGSGERSPNPVSGEIKISLIDWLGYYPFVVADKKGFLDRRLDGTGVHVELYKAENTGEMNDLIRTGKVHGTFGVLADFVILQSLATPIRFVLATDYSKSDVIVAKKGITVPKDLRGKTIGIGELSSFAEYFTIRSLENAGVDRHSVSFRRVPPMEVPEAIQAGKIDAGYTWEPALTRALAAGMNVVISSATSPEMVISGLAFRDEVLVDPTISAAIILAYYDGLAFYLENPNEFAAIVAEYFGTQASEISRIMTKDSLYIDLQSNRKAFEPDGTVQKEMRTINRFFGERGIRQTDESVTTLLDPAPLLEADRLSQVVDK
ncbi:MAG: ABC transporter substrate-binding protein [Bdellovibrionales bacterium]|nr:ABC transporter substrate-binding protein [Bdellovibrionales bacterium]